MKTINCFGDSNTYGYNPVTSGKYSICWVDLLHEKTGDIFINNGMCGREIPGNVYETERAVQVLQEPADRILIMLGSNDLLDGFTADEAGRKMERLLRSVPRKEKIIMISPVPFKSGTWISSGRQIRESEKLQTVYRNVSAKTGIRFAATADWQIPLMFDGVHFTQDGHRIFAERIAELLAKGSA